MLYIPLADPTASYLGTRLRSCSRWNHGSVIHRFTQSFIFQSHSQPRRDLVFQRQLDSAYLLLVARFDETTWVFLFPGGLGTSSACLPLIASDRPAAGPHPPHLTPARCYAACTQHAAHSTHRSAEHCWVGSGWAGLPPKFSSIQIPPGPWEHTRGRGHGTTVYYTAIYFQVSHDIEFALPFLVWTVDASRAGKTTHWRRVSHQPCLPNSSPGVPGSSSSALAPRPPPMCQCFRSAPHLHRSRGAAIACCQRPGPGPGSRPASWPSERVNAGRQALRYHTLPHTVTYLTCSVAPDAYPCLGLRHKPSRFRQSGCPGEMNHASDIISNSLFSRPTHALVRGVTLGAPARPRFMPGCVFARAVRS